MNLSPTNLSPTNLSLTNLSAVRIVLVAPAGPLNIGSVARVMKNFGLTQLVLVTPQCDPLGAEAQQMAVHAKDVLEAAKQVETIPAALDGCNFAIATTARQRGFNAPLEPPESVLPQLISQAQPNSHTALIFGPEDRGLSNEELTYAQRFTKIPTDATYSALNLAQAVAVCCYELHKSSIHQSIQAESIQAESIQAESIQAKSIQAKSIQTESRHFSAAQPKENPAKTSHPPVPSATQTELPASVSPVAQQDALNKRPATAQLNELEGYYEHLERMLLKVEYLYSHTAASRMRKFRQLLNRAAPTSQEVAMLRGMLRQTEWALSNREESRSETLPTERTTESDFN